jgi:hypothetical protein
VFSGVFTAEEVDGTGDKGSRYCNGSCMNTFGGIFEHVSEINLFH